MGLLGYWVQWVTVVWQSVVYVGMGVWVVGFFYWINRLSAITDYQGKIIIFSGPSGAGKGTIIAKLCERFSDIHLAISATTRLPRPYEVDHVAYHFLSKEAFESCRKRQVFIEWCQVHDHFYGTFFSELDVAKHKEGVVFVEIDVKGAKKIKQKIPQAVTIFIAPPSVEVLYERLKTRATETESVIQKRLQEAVKEMDSQKSYDYVILNENLDRCVEAIVAILTTK